MNKVLTKHPTIPILPHKFIVGKRLAQCLNKKLPSGVHLKTIETYIAIFKHIKSAKLAKDLPIYSVGLFSLFPNASVQIKPHVLNIFETYYLPLGSALIPSLEGMIISLLSGLEEEGTDVYNRVSVFNFSLMKDI